MKWKAQCPMVKQKRLPAPILAALQDLKRELSALYGDRLRGIYLYGSFARGDFGNDSDVDVLVVLANAVNPWEEIGRMGRVLSEICLRHDVLLSSYPVPDSWLHERKSPLFQNIRREAVPV